MQLVRDQAHRYAYKITALLCLLVPLYLSLQNVFTPAKFTDFYNSFPVYPNVASQMICKSTVSQPTLCYSPPVPNTSLLLLMRMELLGTRPDMGLYYVLLLLTMALIVWTLPKVIIAWKER